MRHFYFRLILGIVWLAAAVISIMIVNIPLAVLYVVLGLLFFWSACSIREKEKKGEDDRR